MARRTDVPRRIVAVLLVLMAVANAGAAVRLWPDATVLAVAGAVLAVVAAVVAALTGAGRRAGDLLAAIVAGAVGVAVFVLAAVFGLVVESPVSGLVSPWPIAAFLLDGLVARSAVLALRREAGPDAPGPGRSGARRPG